MGGCEGDERRSFKAFNNYFLKRTERNTIGVEDKKKILFFYNLFSDAVSNSDPIPSRESIKYW